MYKTILVNKQNKIKESYLKKIELVNTKDIDSKDVLIEKETYENYLKLKEFLKEKNIEIGISSCYRTIEKQKEIYSEFKEKYGSDYAEKIVAEPRFSEHHTGLAIDINIKVNGSFPKDNIELENHTKYYEEIFKYLKDFGFILRYPKGKEEIIGYPYEPWHIRYVGKVPATIIYENNWTLEEYLQDFSGVIVVNKQPGPTSFDIVNDISHIFGIKKVGHTGTLDPLAEGVLIVAIGKATKIVELLTKEDKEYVATVKLGIETDTYDIEGKVLKSEPVKDNLEIEKALNYYKKTYLQEVPIYSAIKVNGKKLYEYARENKEVELPKKEVTIKEIELLEKSKDEFTFKTCVSKGTYIRSLIRDIGNYLNTPATMKRLIRTKQGNIDISNSNTIEDIKNNNYKLLSIEESLNYKAIELDEETAKKVSNGVKIKNNWNIKDKVIFKHNHKLLGIYEVKDDLLVTWKNL